MINGIFSFLKMEVKAYNYNNINDIKNLLSLFDTNKQNYFKDIKTLQDCKDRFQRWLPQSNDEVFIKIFESITTDFKVYKTLENIIFNKQQNYVKQWYKDEPYAGVFLFQSIIDPKIWIMQAICRFHKPFFNEFNYTR